MNNKDIALYNFDNYMYQNAKYVETEDDFFDKCLDYLGKWLKSLGNKGLEFLKRKYMIGKYSRNLRKKLQVYNKMKPLYSDIKTLIKIISSSEYDKNIYNTYIKYCNKLNNMCIKFSDVLPHLNYLNPSEAIHNYLKIQEYMQSFSGRNGIVIK